MLDHLNDDPALLLLRHQGKTDFDLKAAVQQISARQKAKKKLPEWISNQEIIFPPTLNLEQSSSQATAEFKARGQSGGKFIDLTGGFGVDCYYLGRKFKSAVYCEVNEELAEITSHNLNKLAPEHFEVFTGNGLEYLEQSDETFDLIYLDPARRGHANQKLYKLSDCEPDLVSHWDLIKSKASKVLIKASPMLDISKAWVEIPDIQKVTIVSVKNEVKEVLLEADLTGKKSMEVLAVDLGESESSFSFRPKDEENSKVEFGEASNLLFEPLAAILKAGAFKVFGSRYSLKKLEPNSHFFTSGAIPENIPARVFEVLGEIKPSKSVLKKLFPEGKVNIIARNYSIGPEAFKKKFRLKDGGIDYLIATKTLSGFKVFHCRRIK
ncbi:class I SAM-dependent methyltransferase [Algoriphagus sediminis]|uniref:Class I SAM-dependent methyltransferase n=1 Tax=Algoriphagus sediminis TaxID=3057113 RepID=A0ABT7YG87_9BACT|nr:class I SAM-dependent methyltransferase [Algoriphagus sediminis]MDN3205214.1 class I SAM-dependent methyltransferase [Algoriphagus sediminis]